MDTKNRNSLLGAGYALRSMLLISPVTDVLITAWPLQPSMVNWRFGFLGLLSNSLLVSVMGIVLIAYTAYWMAHRMALRAVSVLCAIGAVVLLASVVMMGLDALQLRNNIRVEMRLSYDFGAMKAVMNYLLSVVVLATIAVGGMLSVRKGRSAKQSRGSDDTPVLVGAARVSAS